MLDEVESQRGDYEVKVFEMNVFWVAEEGGEGVDKKLFYDKKLDKRQ